MNLSNNLSTNIQILNKLLPIQKSFDFITRNLILCNTKAYFIAINGFCQTDILQNIISDLQNSKFTQGETIENLHHFVASKLGYAQVSFADSVEILIDNILSGPSAIILEGFSQAILIDVRTYPTRSISEPDLEKVTRGARDGFVEAMLPNTNLIRRRIRSPKLCFQTQHVGSDSKTDVAIAYLEDKADNQLITKIVNTLNKLEVVNLTMGAKSLEELLLPKRWWNPLPSIQITERPDVACSYLEEGHILLLVDNSPTALILPCSIFQFTQSPEDYYNTTLVGTYFRLVRFLCIPITLLLMPTFLLITSCYPAFAQQYNLLPSNDLGPVRLFIYMMTVEFILDLFKYSSSISSDIFSGSLSLVGGLLIGDLAVSLNWASAEILFYGAITLLTSLSISSREFSDALRLYRIVLILLTGFFGTYGFFIGLGIILFSVVTTPTFGGFSYFWPLLPLNVKALGKILFRSPTPKAQPPKVWNRENK